MVLPILIGAALRLLRLGAQDLWYDEAVTAWIARLPLADLLQAVAGDVHPPLWYLVEWLMVRFPGNTGNQALAWLLRFPAALCSIAALALLPGLARALGLDRRVGVVATWIMALSPFQVWYAQEGRMYALLLLAVELGALAMLKKRPWLFFLAGAIALYSHNIGAIYVLLLAALKLPELVRGWRHKPADLLAYGSILAVYVPWAGVAAGQAGAVAGSFWVQRPAVGAIPLTLHELFWGTAPPAWMGVFAVFVSALAVVAGVWAGVRGRRWALLWLAFAPLLLTWAISQLKPVLIARLMIGCTPFLALLLALALVEHRRTRWLGLAAAPVVALVLVLYFVAPSVQKSDVARFVEPVQERYRASRDGLNGDAVLHTCIPSYVLLSYYAPDLDHYLWRQANDLSQSLTDRTKQAMHMRETTVEVLLQDHARVWVYYSDSPVSSQAEIDETKRIQAAYVVEWVQVLDRSELLESGVYLVERKE